MFKKHSIVFCQRPCTQKLECGHECSGSCSECYQGRLHLSCKQICQQTNICGHQCMEPCNQLCPPCERRCEVRCPHSQCKRSCGEPCLFCEEKCERKCRHGKCKNRCGQPCSRKPCNEKCNKKLPCGHRCRGLCGEPCLTLCPQCNRDTFPKDFLGDDYDANDMFVQLQDCSHILEVTDIDTWMHSEGETIGVRTCPLCRTPIINTYRYKDIVNKRMRTEINPIKRRIYGNEVEIMNKEILIQEKLMDIQKIYEPILKDNASWLYALTTIKRKPRNVFLMKLEMQSVYLDLMDLISELYQKFLQSPVTELRKEMFDNVSLICNFMADNTQKMSQQQQIDVRNEIKRLNGITQLSNILSLGIPKTSAVTKACDAAKHAVFTWQPYKEDIALKAIKKLKDKAHVSGFITKHERDIVIKAIGAKAGSWYKCPNGHFYNIGDCGGAMQVAKCLECNAFIGGVSHRLLSDNKHAPELDDSRHPAWSSYGYNDVWQYRF